MGLRMIIADRRTAIMAVAGASASFWAAAAPASSPPALAADPDWLEGCWTTRSGETREVWARGADTLLFGYNVARKDDAVAFFEQLRLEKRDDGWAYFAYPRGNSPTRFDEADAGAGWIEVRNPAHDYPQRIKYARDGETLRAEISLIDGGDARVWDYKACKN